MKKVKAKEKNEVLWQIVKKKKVRPLSIKIELNPGHHTTFWKATNCAIFQQVNNQKNKQSFFFSKSNLTIVAVLRQSL